MDVGADNFHFALEDRNGLKKDTSTSRQPKTTELRIDSLDRYMPTDLVTTTYFLNFPNQTVAKLVGPNLLSSFDSGTSVQINTGRNLNSGYFSRLALTQMSLNYRVPTITSGVNDLITYVTVVGGTPTLRSLTIPQGYYTWATMAAQLQTQFRLVGVLSAMTVTPPNTINAAVGTSLNTGFIFNTGVGTTTMYFTYGAAGTSETAQIHVGKTFRTLGVNRALLGYTPEFNSVGQPTGAPTAWLGPTQGGKPNFLPTDYIDIASQALTNYKDAKDANSSVQAPVTVLGRIYLTECPLVFPSSGSSGTANGVPADATLLGCGPISFTKNWYNPNWCQWSPNQSLTGLDIQLLDMWGNQVYWTPSNPTEWSCTVTFTE